MIRPVASQIALNEAQADAALVLGEAHAIALNAEGGAPDWVMLIPKGPRIIGNDGRRFTLGEPNDVIAAFNAAGLALPIDVNHAEFLKAPQGEESPAAGWIEALEVRGGAIWGRVDWTEDGRAALNARRYRYVSPALRTDQDGNVLGLAGAGLVNRPNFSMPALNGREEDNVDKELLKKLGLSETATAQEAVAAIEKLQTQLNAAKTTPPALADYVPRADYDLALNARREAESELADHQKSAREAEVNALIDGAIAKGQIAPATKGTYVALCATEASVVEFKKFLEAQPSVFKTSDLGRRSADDGVQTALNADERALLAMTNLTEKEFLASKAMGPVPVMAA